MTDSAPMSSDGYPVSATTELKYKNIIDERAKRNAEIIKKLEAQNTEKDENQILGEQLEKQIGEKMGNLSNVLLKMARCPCCSEYYMGNVMQCENGHCICETCRNKLHACLFCKKPYGKYLIRNRQTEELLTEMDITVPCAYSSRGCTESILFSKAHEHRRKCLFRPIDCFYGLHCNYQADNVNDYAEHITNVHGALPTDTPDMDFFEINIVNMIGAINDNGSIVSYIHKYGDDYLLIQFTNMHNTYNYVMTVHSLKKAFYRFSATINVSNMMYVCQHEFTVQPINILNNLYTKQFHSTQFYEQFQKLYGWHSATLSYNKMTELASYPSATINCMIIQPTERDIERFERLDDPNVMLMDEAQTEPLLTQEEIDLITNVDESNGQFVSVNNGDNNDDDNDDDDDYNPALIEMDDDNMN